MKRYLPAVLAGLVVSALGVAGCQDADHYSAAVRYGVRTDPLVVASNPGQLGADRDEPDRPGVLPLYHLKDVLTPENPLYPKSKELTTDPKMLLDPTLLPKADRDKLDEALVALFGTPSAPKVEGIESADQKTLQLDEATLKEGGRLYRIHCVHCHGVPGDGHGPTGRWISPHPRDFRPGLFKFMSVDQSNATKTNRPPRRGDLYRTVRNGIEGTAMPSFLLLRSEELEHLVSYVIHLSMRGKAEFATIAGTFDYTMDPKSGAVTVTKSELSPGIAADVKKFHGDNVAKWVESQAPASEIKIPEPYVPAKVTGPEAKVWQGKSDEQVARIKGALAQALFNNEEAALPEARRVLEARGDKPENVNCKTCHNDYGRQAKFKFDSWGTLVRPNNFVLGVFRGGRRPKDIYHRIHSGINGSNMVAYGATISPNSLWDMVEFVQALSYPAMRNRLGIQLSE